ncbi:putative bifunctional diguanylate cyclase/phosphodiesterase [Roseofilum casamattae]|uniref:EAL domain-containing protein n=1 Tax=Roseofilum casamattae BLCC-M143 TaxID=3022442 RepID=A0ABT7BUM6_9CYAN|nr:GGDEF and EAL domain-containing protein [Roseofilum casamattae]MDJ1182795.1 EAL domain-containing protein [Roseofilum casamattae BLCC-M143]
MLDLEYHIRLLQGVAQATHSLLTVSNREEAIDLALASLGEALSVDRVYLFYNHIDPMAGQLLASQLREWIATTVTLPFNNLELKNLPYSTLLSQWYTPLSEGKIIRRSRKQFVDEEQQLLRDRHVHSVLVLPIFVRENFWGFIEFDDCRINRHWTTDEVGVISTIADGFGSAIAHHQGQTELNKIQTQLEAKIQERTLKLRAAVQQLKAEIQNKEEIANQLRYNAYHHPLTGLPNRILLIQRLQELMIKIQGNLECDRFAILFLDLDRFKLVNDSFGHSLGDMLLIQLAERLKTVTQQQVELAPEHVLIAHLGSDEFAILLSELKDFSQASRLAEAIHHSMLDSFNLEGHEILSTVSIGIAPSSTIYKQPEEILRDADLVMYEAKSKGRARYEIFNLETHQRVMGQLQLETDLRKAVQVLQNLPATSDCPFILYYQPIIDLRTGEIGGFEALIRWKHPDLGMVSPALFIPIAEETGLINPIGQWVLEEACHCLHFWEKHEHYPLTMSVNLSGSQLSRPNLLASIDRILDKAGVLPRHLKLEITESTIINHGELVTSTLQQLKERAIALCMDDFGTGYSSLSYLHRFPFDVLKVDKSFISNMGEEDKKLDIVRTIVNLAHHLKMEAVAEGVETAEQLQILSELGCEWGQGYYFSRPLDRDRASELLRQYPYPWMA